MNAAGAIGAITAPLEPRRGATLIGLRRRTSAARAGSVISAAGSVTADASSPPAAAARLWSVPPEIMSEGRGIPGGPSTLTSRSASASPSPKRSRAVSAASSTAQVRRQRLEPAHLHDLHSRLRGARVVGVDHLAHERDLSGQVHVMRAVGDARLDHRLPVERVGADEVQHHARARRPSPPASGVAHVRDDRLRRRHADLGQHLLAASPASRAAAAQRAPVAPHCSAR